MRLGLLIAMRLGLLMALRLGFPIALSARGSTYRLGAWLVATLLGRTGENP
jgi:hypothetical protein